MTIMMMSLVVTMDQRQAVRREMIQQMEQGATASDVRRLCPIPLKVSIAIKYALVWTTETV